MAGLKLVCIAVVCMVLASATVEAISCGQVIGYLTPCINYAKGGIANVPAECCTGVRNLNSAATTTQDRQTTCNCMKTAAASISGINFGIVATIPGKCSVSIPYKLSPKTDCSKVQ